MNVMDESIKLWATERGLHKADPQSQMLKVTEEVGEVAGALARNDINSVKEEIGDVLVTLIILSMQLNINIDDCKRAAYVKIKHRKGKMINGIYVKEEDLHD